MSILNGEVFLHIADIEISYDYFLDYDILFE